MPADSGEAINHHDQRRLNPGLPKLTSVKDRLFIAMRIGHKARLLFIARATLTGRRNRTGIIKKIGFKDLIIDATIGQEFEILLPQIMHQRLALAVEKPRFVHIIALIAMPNTPRNNQRQRSQTGDSQPTA
jgi:hypothetical protein